MRKHICSIGIAQLIRVDRARICLGLTEGGLGAGIAYYVSLWYPRQMQAQRIAIYFSMASVAGAFGGIMACVTVFKLQT